MLPAQVPGHFLTHADITPSLKGRLAELFWPDEALAGWYLIEIQVGRCIMLHEVQLTCYLSSG